MLIALPSSSCNFCQNVFVWIGTCESILQHRQSIALPSIHVSECLCCINKLARLPHRDRRVINVTLLCGAQQAILSMTGQCGSEIVLLTIYEHGWILITASRGQMHQKMNLELLGTTLRSSVRSSKSPSFHWSSSDRLGKYLPHLHLPFPRHGVSFQSKMAARRIP